MKYWVKFPGDIYRDSNFKKLMENGGSEVTFLWMLLLSMRKSIVLKDEETGIFVLEISEHELSKIMKLRSDRVRNLMAKLWKILVPKNHIAEKICINRWSKLATKLQLHCQNMHVSVQTVAKIGIEVGTLYGQDIEFTDIFEGLERIERKKEQKTNFSFKKTEHEIHKPTDDFFENELKKFHGDL